jgi:hypothetical protein
MGRRAGEVPVTYESPLPHDGQGPDFYGELTDPFERAARTHPEPDFRDQRTAARWRTARRAALDHVLSLITDAPWSESLVLRGSMLMPAWVGDEARVPGDLDFVVLPELAVPIDPLHPFPYVDEIDAVQEWPEAADGAARYDIWKDGEEEFETRGLRPALPPEGLRWDIDRDNPDTLPPYDDLMGLLSQRPEAPSGVVLDADRAHTDSLWAYGAYGGYEGRDGNDGIDGYGSGGVRIIVPWQAEGLPPGQTQLDFALDERLPQAPVWTLVPRGDGGAPFLVRTVSRELSLAWKLLWLHTDGSGPQCKDLYDAVLLAEADGTRLSPVLLREVLRGLGIGAGPYGFRPESVRLDEADWKAFCIGHPHVRGTAEQWLVRLTMALTSMLGESDGDGRGPNSQACRV